MSRRGGRVAADRPHAMSLAPLTVVVALFGLGTLITCVNVYTSFIRYPLHRWRGGTADDFRWISGFPLFGSLFLWLAALLLIPWPVLMWTALVISLLDTGGLHWFAGTMIYMRSSAGERTGHREPPMNAAPGQPLHVGAIARTMSNPTSSMAAETEALREAYGALNSNDIPGFVSIFDPQIERVELLEPQGRSYQGLDAVTAHVVKGRGTWAEGGCEPQRFIVAGDRVIVLVHVRVRVKNETEWREGDVADVFTFRNGKAIEFRTFSEERQALEWAGVKASDAS